MATHAVSKVAKAPGDSNLEDATELSDVCKSACEIKELILKSFAMYSFQGRQGGTCIIFWKCTASSPKLN